MVEPSGIGVDAQSDTARASNLIASDKVEGTEVHLGGAASVGYIKRLLIDKPSGRIVYAILRITNMSGQPANERAVPWRALTYNTGLRAYEINSTDEKLRSGPTYPETTSDPTFDPAWEEHVHQYFNTEPYWKSETDRATDVPFGKKKT
ncbi:PRC-barrel domain-containing protein [Methylobacterium sp. P31]